MKNILKVLLPKRAGNKKGQSATSTFQSNNRDQVLSLPAYRDHLEDIFTTRVSSDSRALLQQLFRHDSDVSAAVNAYLTVANTDPQILVYDLEGNLDRDGYKTVQQIILGMTSRIDYSKGFKLIPSLRSIAEN